jgi:hypothetical protein
LLDAFGTVQFPQSTASKQKAIMKFAKANRIPLFAKPSGGSQIVQHCSLHINTAKKQMPPSGGIWI